jgi:hypothetical protein
VDSGDGPRPPALTTGASTASRRSFPFMLGFIVPVSPRQMGVQGNRVQLTARRAFVLRSFGVAA